MFLSNYLILSTCIHMNGLTTAVVINQYQHRPASFKVYYNLKSVLKDYDSRQYSTLSAVQKTLYAFEHICMKGVLYRKSGKRRPFIVVEGTDKILVSAVAKSLNLIMGATYLHNPPKCLRPLLGKFQHTSPLRRTFYALGNYVISQTAKNTYNRYTVVSPGYWLEQAAFAMANNFKRRPLPPPGESVYTWPSDLLPPDVIYHLRTPKTEETLMWNPSAKYDWRTRAIDVYNLIRYPKVVGLDARIGIPKLLETIIDHINTTMREKFFVTVRNVRSVFPLLYPNLTTYVSDYGNITDPT